MSLLEKTEITLRSIDDEGSPSLSAELLAAEELANQFSYLDPKPYSIPARHLYIRETKENR